MAADLTVEPWVRLVKLAPPGTSGTDLQAAADRYVLRGDVKRAAADLWEEKALSYDAQLASGPIVASATQDGMAVSYVDPVASLTAASAAAWQMCNRLRATAKAYSALVHDPCDDPWGHSVASDLRDFRAYDATKELDEDSNDSTGYVIATDLEAT